jgi:Ca2+-binding EF-hand superfamily protein
MFQRLLFAGVLIVFPGIVLAQQPCTSDARHVVDELYRHMLERQADAGSNNWVSKLQSGSTVREVVHAIVDSPEHMQRFYNPSEGAVANERAIANLYRHILGRQPDAAGLRASTDLAAKSGLHAVAHAILDSAEYNRTLGDWGVPGSGGLVYCGGGSVARSAPAPAPVESTPRAQRQFADRDSFGMPANDRFSYLDVNRDGAIERNEWDGSLDEFYRLDRNNDGRLTRAEFGSVRSSSSQFDALDLNGDGRITLGEWPYSHRSFDDQDVNGDGVITRGELRPATLPAPVR